MNIVYLHGLSSSGQSNTANKLRALFPDDNIIAPDLPVNPNKALNLITDILQKLSVDNTIVIGSSMGAMFAHQQAPFRRLLINPAFHVSEMLQDNLGKTLPFYSQRQDGIREFTVTEELCSLYKRVEEEQFKYRSNSGRQDVVGIFGLQDNLVDCKGEFTDYYSIYHEFAGGHRLTDTDIETVLKPIICWMKNSVCPELIPIAFECIEPGDTASIISDSKYSSILAVPPLPASRQRSTYISSAPSFRPAIFPFRYSVQSGFRPCRTRSATFRPVPWLRLSGSGVPCGPGWGRGFPLRRSFSTVPFRPRIRHIPVVRSGCTRTVWFPVCCLPLRAAGLDLECFKIFDKGIGRKWFDEIYQKYEGKKMYEQWQYHLTFPDLPNGESEDSVQLVLGSRYSGHLSVEVYGENGVQVFDPDKFYIDGLEMHRL